MRRLLLLLLLLPLLALAILRPLRRDAGRTEDSRQWPVMGTFLNVTAYGRDTTVARAAVRAAGRTVFRVDSLMSTWNPASEIARLNAAAGSASWTPLSPETLAVLLASRQLARASQDAFDVTVGPLMHVWGFRGGEPHVPPPTSLDSARSLVGPELLELDSAGRRARLRRVGASVDLGGIAKGYALDLAAAAMQRAGADAAMLDLGGNVLVYGAAPGRRAEWIVGILDPRDPAATIGEIRLASGSVATSGDYEQFFELGGVRYSHIMDPALGRPARGTLQVTVVAPTGLQADALSTALFVQGPERGRQLLAEPLGRGTTAVWVRDSLPLERADVVVAGASPDRVLIQLPAAQ